MDHPEVTPQQQAALRTSRKKTLKKGRKKTKGKGAKGGKGPKGGKVPKGSGGETSKGGSPRKPSHRRQILRSKSSNDPEGKGGSKTKKAQVQPKAKARSKKAPQKSKDLEAAGKTHRAQKRLDTGDGRWMYEVLPDQIYGCSNCRCIFGGCKVCKREGFRGKSAAFFRQYQTAQCSSVGSEPNDDAQKKPKVKTTKRKAKNDGQADKQPRKSRKSIPSTKG